MVALGGFCCWLFGAVCQGAGGTGQPSHSGDPLRSGAVQPDRSGAGRTHRCLCHPHSPGHQLWRSEAQAAPPPGQAPRRRDPPNLASPPAPLPRFFWLYIQNSLFHGQQKGATAQRD